MYVFYMFWNHRDLQEAILQLIKLVEVPKSHDNDFGQMLEIHRFPYILSFLSPFLTFLYKLRCTQQHGSLLCQARNHCQNAWTFPVCL